LEKGRSRFIRRLCVVSDERLVAAAKIGHSGAFDDVYKRHAEKMFRITYRITRNREDAEDFPLG